MLQKSFSLPIHRDYENAEQLKQMLLEEVAEGTQVEVICETPIIGAHTRYQFLCDLWAMEKIEKRHNMGNRRSLSIIQWWDYFHCTNHSKIKMTGVEALG